MARHTKWTEKELQHIKDSWVAYADIETILRNTPSRRLASILAQARKMGLEGVPTLSKEEHAIHSYDEFNKKTGLFQNPKHRNLVHIYPEFIPADKDEIIKETPKVENTEVVDNRSQMMRDIIKEEGWTEEDALTMLKTFMTLKKRCNHGFLESIELVKKLVAVNRKESLIQAIEQSLYSLTQE